MDLRISQTKSHCTSWEVYLWSCIKSYKIPFFNIYSNLSLLSKYELMNSIQLPKLIVKSQHINLNHKSSFDLLPFLFNWFLHSEIHALRKVNGSTNKLIYFYNGIMSFPSCDIKNLQLRPFNYSIKTLYSYFIYLIYLIIIEVKIQFIIV